MSFLDTINILQPLSQQERDNMANFCQERHVKKGEVLFCEGDEANAMYILKEGTIGIYKKINGEETFIWNVAAEEILWEMALFRNNGVRMAKAIAEVDSTLIVILSFSISELTRKNPIIMDKIHQIIDERVMRNKTLEK